MSKLSEREFLALRGELIALSRELEELSKTGAPVSRDLASRSSDLLERYFHLTFEDHERREGLSIGGRLRGDQKKALAKTKGQDARARAAKLLKSSKKKYRPTSLATEVRDGILRGVLPNGELPPPWNHDNGTLPDVKTIRNYLKQK